MINKIQVQLLKLQIKLAIVFLEFPNVNPISPVINNNFTDNKLSSNYKIYRFSLPGILIEFNKK